MKVLFVSNKMNVLHLSKRCISNMFKEKMWFIQYELEPGGLQYVGIQENENGDILSLSATDSSVPNSMVQFLSQNEDLTLERTKRIAEFGKHLIPFNFVNLLAPVTRMDKVICVAMNYGSFCEEVNKSKPTEPTIVSKFSSTVIGPMASIQIPAISTTAKNVAEKDANKYIFGYTIAQDISARDWMKKNNGQFLLGKTMDTFCPLGPCIIPKEYIDPENLRLKTIVNGKLKQDGIVSDLIFKVNFLISYLSQIMTLYPGDVISTGTPAGVGANKKPPEFLKADDILESEIEGIGRMRNVCI